MRDIALIGKARSGKDSVAQVLTEEFGYKRLAFADELKKAALRIDPYVYTACCRPDECCDNDSDYRLSDFVAEDGWDVAKGDPDVRRFLQNLGNAMRQVDPYVWIRAVENQYDDMDSSDPVVITDCRYRNEADTLHAAGFLLVRVVRPGTGGDSHVSETELDGFPVDVTLKNSGSLEDLATTVRNLMRGLE